MTLAIAISVLVAALIAALVVTAVWKDREREAVEARARRNLMRGIAEHKESEDA